MLKNDVDETFILCLFVRKNVYFLFNFCRCPQLAWSTDFVSQSVAKVFSRSKNVRLKSQKQTFRIRCLHTILDDLNLEPNNFP